MKNIVFFFKVLVFTFSVVLILQVKVKEQTLEDRTLEWIKNSSFIQPLQDFTLASLILSKKTLKDFVNKIQSKLSHSNPSFPIGSRALKFKMKRSKEVLENENQKMIDEQWGEKLRPKIEDLKLQPKKVKSKFPSPARIEIQSSKSIRPDV